MADTRYVIDLIINARDNTAAAFADVVGKSKAMESALDRIGKEQTRQNQELERSFNDLSKTIGTSETTLRKMRNEISMTNAEASNIAQGIVKLQAATKSYVSAVDEHGKKSAQAFLALEKLRDIEDDLGKAYVKSGDELGKVTAKTVTETTLRIEQAQRELDNYQKAAKARAAADREAAEERAKQMRLGEDMAAEIEATGLARLKANVEERKRLYAQAARDRADQERLGAEIAAEIEEAGQARLKAAVQERGRILAQAAKERAEQERRGAEISAEIEATGTARLRANVEERKRQNAEQQRQIGLSEQYLRQIEQIANLERQRGEAAERKDVVGVAKIDIDTAGVVAEAQATAAELKAIFGRIPVDFDIESAGADAHMVALVAQKKLLEGDIKFDVDVDVAGSIAKLTAVKAAAEGVSGSGITLKSAWDEMGAVFQKTAGNISSFDNLLRGLMSLAIAVFLNQIILLAGALASAFLSLASSAAFAGAAIGGALTAGIAQVIPMVGILVAAFSRVAAVMDAAKQAQLLEQQQSYQGTQQAKQQANAADQVRSAQERLADTHRRLAEAQGEINDARQEGIDKLRELIFQERGLTLTMEETQNAIRDAAQAGDVSALPRLFLQRDTTAQQLGGVREEIAERQEAGPGGSPEMVQALENVADAQRAVKDAERGLVRARRSSIEAAAGITAAAGKLDFLMGQLSEAEKRLYEAVRRLQDVWRDFAQEATEPLINAFTGAINKIIGLLETPRIRAAARSLATGLATQFTRIFDEFTSNPAITQMLRIVEDSKENLKPLGGIAIDIGHAFLDIAEAAGPALNEILEWIKDITGNVAKFFEEGRKSGDLQKFFSEGVKHLKAWGDLLWAVVELFAAIAGEGGGGKAGLKLVRDMADGIGKMADQISKPGSKLNEFFNRFFELGRKMLDTFGPVLTAIGEEFSKTFTEDGLHSVEGFATFLADVLIPAIGDFIRFLGDITGALGEIGREHPAFLNLAAAVTAAVLSMTVLAKSFAFIRPALVPLELLAGKFLNIGKYAEGAGRKGKKAIEDVAGAAPGRRGARAGPGVAAAVGGEAVADASLGGGGKKVGDEADDAAKKGGRMRRAFKEGFDEADKGGSKFRRTLSVLAAPLALVGTGIGKVVARIPILNRMGGVFTSIGKSIGGILPFLGRLGGGFLTLLARIPGVGLLGRVFTSIGGIIGKLIGPLLRLVTYFGRFAALGAGPIAIIVGVLIGLLAYSGKLDDVWRKIVETGKEIWREIQPGIESLKESVGGLIDAFSGDGGGLLNVIQDVVKFIGRLFAGGLMEAINSIGIVVQNVFKGVFKVLGGFIDLITFVVKLLKGDFGGAWEALKSGLGKIAEGIFDALWGLLSGIGGFFVRLFKRAITALLGLFGIGSPSKVFIKMGQDIVDGFWEGIKGIAGWVWDKLKAAIRNVIRGYAAIGRWIVNAVWNGLKAIGGLIKDVAVWLWDKWVGYIRLVIRGWTTIGRWIVNAVWNSLKAIGGFIKEVAVWLWDKFKEFIRLQVRGWKTIGTWIWNAIKDSVSTVVDKFKEVGKTIFTAIVDGLKSAPGLLKDALGWIIDHAPGLPGFIKDKMKDVIGLQEGGPIPGSGSGDIVPAMLEPGEHVWTRREVQAAGGHQIMFALRRLLGGGGQSVTHRFQPGGAVYDPRTGLYHGGGGGQPDPYRLTFKPPDAGAEPESPEEVETKRKAYKKSGDERAKDWRTMWNDMLTTARRTANDIEEQIRDLKDNTTITMRRMRINMEKILDDILKSFKVSGTRIQNTWASTVDSLKSTVYRGLDYIGHETNKALKALGADIIHFGLTAPGKSSRGKDPGSVSPNEGATFTASGGMVGMSGERGRDRVNTWLGRGEAVLNFAHQKYLEPAVQSYYGHGLHDTFRRVHGYHAGGPGAPGYAVGGAIDVKGSKAGFGMLMQYFRRRFNDPSLYVMSGIRPGSRVLGSGNLSNHSTGDAIDISNPTSDAGNQSNPPPTNSLDRLYAFLQSWPSPPKRDLLWRTMTGGNHYNHVHLGMDPIVTATMAAARAFLSKFPGGGDFATEVGRQIVRGLGPLRDLGQEILDKVRKAANEKIESEMGDVYGGGPSSVKLGPGGPAEQVFNFFKGHGLSDAIAAGFVGVFQKESQFNTTVENPTSGALGLAQWLAGRKDKLLAKHDWRSLQTQLDYVWEELMGVEGAAFQAIKGARTPDEAARIIDSMYERSDNLLAAPEYAVDAYQQFSGQADHPPTRRATGGVVVASGGEYAMGGEIPGGGGRPIPIIAHEGEWVLNPHQQGTVASWLGVGVDALRNRLGFRGGPTHFQEGGVPTFRERRREFRRTGVYELPEFDPRALEGIFREIKLINVAINRLAKGEIKNSLDKFLKNLDQLTREDGYLDDLGVALERLSERLQTGIDLAQVGLRRVNGRLRRRPGGALVDAVKIADRTLDMYDTLYESLRKRRGIEAEGLRDTQKELDKARAAMDKDGATKKEKENFTRLIAERNKFIDRLDATDAEIAENRASRFTALTERFAARTERQLRPSTRALRRIEVRTRVAQAFGDEETVRAQGVAQLALLEQQRTILRQRRDAAQARAKRDPRWRAIADDLTSQIQDLNGTIAEQIVANNQAIVEAINTNISRRQAGVDIQRRIAAAFGRTGEMEGFGTQQIALLQEQQARLRAALSQITPDDVGTRRALEEQIAELDASIAEAVAARFADAVTEVDRVAQRNLNLIDIRGRLADVVERLGGRQTAAGQRIGLSRERGAELVTQRDALLRLQARAQLEGNTGAVEELGDRILDLNAQIEENAQTTQELIIANHQLTAEIIKSRQQTTTGLFGVGQSILTAVGELAGLVDPARMRPFLEATRDVILQAGRGLVDAITVALLDPDNPFGKFADQAEPILAAASAAFQAGPDAFANWLLENATGIADLVEQMGGTGSPMGQLFLGFINGLGDNTLELLANTKSLNDLNGTMGQTFSSSLWQLFRSPIFTGNTQLRPDYQWAFPQMQSGGYITKTGMFRLHAGEKVVPASAVRGGEHLEQHLYITNPTEVADPDYIFAVAEFNRSNRRAT